MNDEDHEVWLDGYKEHGLTWGEWKELSNQERERIRIPDTGKKVPGHVNSKLANSKHMHDKFESLTNHKLVNESLYNNSYGLLLDNNDIEFEHLIAIDSRIGTLLVKNTESANAGLTHQCAFSKKQNQNLKEGEILFETLHNHLISSIPSRDDIKKLFERKYQSASNVICHDTKVHRLEKIKEFDEIESFIDKVYHKFKEKYSAYGDNKIESYFSEELIKMLVRGYLKYVKR